MQLKRCPIPRKGVYKNLHDELRYALLVVRIALDRICSLLVISRKLYIDNHPYCYAHRR